MATRFCLSPDGIKHIVRAVRKTVPEKTTHIICWRTHKNTVWPKQMVHLPRWPCQLRNSSWITGSRFRTEMLRWEFSTGANRRGNVSMEGKLDMPEGQRRWKRDLDKQSVQKEDKRYEEKILCEAGSSEDLCASLDWRACFQIWTTPATCPEGTNGLTFQLF